MQKILDVLTEIENTRNVSILYAAESGSRAWEFASPNSDYDVRFIYAHPMKHYLSFDVELKRDVIEIDSVADTLDITGWDIRKALHLFTRSNGTLLEWLRSPIRYRSTHTAIVSLTELASEAFDPTALMYHYYRMGRNNAREFLKGDVVSLKKYLYVVRCFVAVDFLRARLALPPVSFVELLEVASNTSRNIAVMRDAALELIHRKRGMLELGTGSRIPELDTYISESLSVNEKTFGGFRKDDLRQRRWDEKLNGIFRCAIGYGDKTE